MRDIMERRREAVVRFRSHAVEGARRVETQYGPELRPKGGTRARAAASLDPWRDFTVPWCRERRGNGLRRSRISGDWDAIAWSVALPCGTEPFLVRGETSDSHPKNSSPCSGPRIHVRQAP